MLYHLLVPLADEIGVFNVFRYITFRAAAAGVTALVLSLLLGPWLVRTLRRLSIGQSIREVGPERHERSVDLSREVRDHARARDISLV